MQQRCYYSRALRSAHTHAQTFRRNIELNKDAPTSRPTPTLLISLTPLWSSSTVALALEMNGCMFY